MMRVPASTTHAGRGKEVDEVLEPFFCLLGILLHQLNRERWSPRALPIQPAPNKPALQQVIPHGLIVTAHCVMPGKN